MANLIFALIALAASAHVALAIIPKPSGEASVVDRLSGEASPPASKPQDTINNPCGGVSAEHAAPWLLSFEQLVQNEYQRVEGCIGALVALDGHGDKTDIFVTTASCADKEYGKVLRVISGDNRQSSVIISMGKPLYRAVPENSDIALVILQNYMTIDSDGGQSTCWTEQLNEISAGFSTYAEEIKRKAKATTRLMSFDPWQGQQP